MSHLVQLQLATHAAIANLASPDAQVFEGVVIGGSWEAAEGTCQVIIGETVGYESPFFNENGLNQPLMPVCRIINHAIGDQYGPVGGERAVIWETQGGWVCKLVHGPDDSSPVPSGERWIQHRSQAAVVAAVQGAQDSGEGGFDSGRGGFDALESPADPPIPVVWDSSLKLTNDGPSTGDMLGGAILGGKGALTQSQTASGARSTIDDTARSIEHVTAGGLTVAQLDEMKQIVHSVVAGALQTVIDGIAETITHQASSGVKQILDARGKTISLVVPNLADGGTVGLGDLFENLPSGSGAVNNAILMAFSSNIRQTVGNVAQQMAQAAIAAGVPNATTWLAGIQAGLPSLSFINILSSVASLTTPAGSGVVRIAS